MGQPLRPADYLSRAIELVEGGDRPAAVEVLRRGVRTATGVEEAAGLLLGLTQLCLDGKDSAGALRALTDLRGRAGRAGDVGFERMALVNMVMVTGMRHEFDDAVHHAEQLPDLLGDDDAEQPAGIVLKAARDAYYEADDYANALALANVVVRLAPDSEFGWFLAGNAALRLERPADALPALTRASELKPDHPGLHLSRAKALQELDRVDEAIEAIERAVALAPADPRHRHSRARLLLAAGRDEEALEAFADAVAAARAVPVEEATYRSLAQYQREIPAEHIGDMATLDRVRLLFRLGRDEQATAEARALVGTAARPMQAHALAMVGDSLLAGGAAQAWAAATTYGQALDLGAGPDARLGRARALLAAGDLPAALADLDALCGISDEHDAAGAARVTAELLATAPDTPGARTVLGRALLSDWRPGAAVPALDRALEADPADWRALLWRGLARVTHSNEEEDWNEGLSVPRIHAALADLAAAARAAPPDNGYPRRALRWLVERAVSIPPVHEDLCTGAADDLPDQLAAVIPELAPVFALTGTAMEHMMANQWPEAVAVLDRARAAIAPAGLPIHAAQVDLMLADNLLRTYQLQRALDHLAAVEAVLSYLGDLIEPMREPYVSMRDSMVHRRGQRFLGIDMDHLELSSWAVLSTFRTATMLRAEAMARVGDPAAALESIHDLDGLLEEVAEGNQVHRAFPVIAMLRDSERYDRALSIVDSVRPHAESGYARERLDNLELSIRVATGELDRAQELFEGAMARAAGDPTAAAVTASNYAQVEMRRGAYGRALRLLTDHPPPAGTTPLLRANWYAVRGIVQAQRRHWRQAEEDLVAALDLYDQVRGGLRLEGARISWHAGRMDAIAWAVAAAVAAGHTERALELTERARSRAFVDQLELGQPQLTPRAVALAGAVEQAQSRRRLLRRLAALPDPAADRDGLRELVALGGELRGPADPETVSKALAAESAGLATLQERLQAATLGERESIGAAAAPVDRIRALLAGGRTVLAEYWASDLGMLLFLVGADGAVSVHDPGLDPADLRDRAAAWLANPLGARAEDLDAFAPLLEPVLAATEPGDLIVIVPHGPLHAVPLHAVGGLVERNPVCYVPSASVLAQCRERRAGRAAPRGWEHALVVGDPLDDLPFARAEARTVADLFGTRPYLSVDADRDTLTGPRAEDPQVVHLACHGLFDSAQPLDSGIQLADGLFTASRRTGCGCGPGWSPSVPARAG